MATIDLDIIARIEDLERQFRRAENTVTSAFDNMRQAASGLFAGIGFAEVVTNIVSVGREFENMQARLQTVTGSAQSAEKALNALSAFDLSQTLGLGAVTDAFIKLQALGLNPTLESIRSFANTAAAMGRDLDQFIEAVADAVTFEFERLKEFGIKSSQEGDKVKFTFQGVTTEVEKNANAVEAFLRGIGESQFAGAVERQADTIGGAFKRVNNSANDAALAIFQFELQLNESKVFSFREAILALSTGFEKLFKSIADGVNSLQSIEKLNIRNVNEQIRESAANVFELQSSLSSLTGIDAALPLKEFLSELEKFNLSDLSGFDRTRAGFQIKDLRDLAAELEELKIRRDELQTPLEIPPLDKGENSFSGSLKKAGENAKKAKKAYEDLVDFVINIVDRFDPVTAAYRKQAEEIKRLDEALKKGIISQERYNTLIDKLDEELKDTIDPLREFARQMKEQQRLAAVVDPALREQEQSVARLADEYTRLGLVMSDEVADGVRVAAAELQRIEQQTDSARAVTEAFTLDAREFTDAWISGLSSVADFMAEGLVNGFDNAADAIKGAFKTLLAELIRVAVLNPVLLQVGLGGLGLAGLGPGAAGTAAGGVGLLGSGLSSILGNFAGAGVSLLGQGLFGAGAGAFGSGVLASGGALSGLGLFGGTAANIGNVASLFGAGQFAAGGGALLGAALPILAPLAIGAIASGLFGNQEPPGRSQTASINITAGTLNFAGSAPGDSKFSEENRGIAQSTAQQVAAFTGVINQFEDAMLRAVSFGGDEITARLQDLVIGVEISDRDNESRIVIDTEATGRLFEEIFSKGEEAEAIASAIDFILDSLEGLPDFFAPIVAQFDRTDPERLLQGAQALADINRALEVDIVKEFNRQLRESNRTLAEVTLDQGLAVLDMARSFDGSIDATLQLSQATGQFFQTTFALLAQIQEISASLASSFQASIERFQIAALDQSQTYEFFVARAERAFNQLRDATDPAQIEQAAREFDRFLNSAFGVLSPEQQAAMSQAFIDAAEEGNRIAQERLDAAADQAATGTEQLQAAIADALGRVAGTMQAAGDAQLQAGNLQIQAAATPITVRVEFDDAEAA